jgi:hypothetical protein
VFLTRNINHKTKGQIMKTQTQPIEPTTSALNPIRILGGLLSDTVEVIKTVGEEITEIPDALADGWNNGALIDTDNAKALKARTTQIVETVKQQKEPLTKEQQADIDSQIKQLQDLKKA